MLFLISLHHLRKKNLLIIQLNLFEIKKPFLSLEVPYSELNGTVLKRSINNFHQFTDKKFDIVKWIIKRV